MFSVWGGDVAAACNGTHSRGVAVVCTGAHYSVSHGWANARGGQETFFRGVFLVCSTGSKKKHTALFVGWWLSAEGRLIISGFMVLAWGGVLLRGGNFLCCQKVLSGAGQWVVFGSIWETHRIFPWCRVADEEAHMC